MMLRYCKKIVMWWDKYKLVVTENKSQYFLKVFSNGILLYFLLDSGANKSLVRKFMLTNCTFSPSTDRFKVTGIGGEKETAGVHLFFDLSRKDSVKGKYRFDFIFGSIPEDFHPLLSGPIAGLLGTDFLSLCTVNFKKGLIKLY